MEYISPMEHAFMAADSARRTAEGAAASEEDLRKRVKTLEEDAERMRALLLRIVNGQRVEGIRFRKDGSVYFEGRKRRVRYAYTMLRRPLNAGVEEVDV